MDPYQIPPAGGGTGGFYAPPEPPPVDPNEEWYGPTFNAPYAPPPIGYTPPGADLMGYPTSSYESYRPPEYTGLRDMRIAVAGDYDSQGNYGGGYYEPNPSYYLPGIAPPDYEQPNYRPPAPDDEPSYP